MLVLSHKQAVVPPLEGHRWDSVHLAVEHEGLLLHGDDVAGLQREGQLSFATHPWRHAHNRSERCVSVNIVSISGRACDAVIHFPKVMLSTPVVHVTPCETHTVETIEELTLRHQKCRYGAHWGGVKRGAPVSRARVLASIEQTVECRIPSESPGGKNPTIFTANLLTSHRGLAENKLRSLLKR